MRGRDAAGAWGNATGQTFLVNGDQLTGVDGTLPRVFALQGAVPNPFNPTTTIRYALPRASRVALVIYDVRGTKVRTLAAGRQEAGYRSVVWDGKGERGTAVPSGVYFYRLTAGDFRATRKAVLLK